MKLTLRFTILAMLSGCAHFQDKPLNPVASIKHLEARNLNNSELQAYFDAAKLPQNSPWNLAKLTLAAMFYHPDLAIARAQADSADAANITAAQRPNPNLTLTPTWISNLAAVTPWILVSALNIPIETAGKRGYRMDKSQHLSEAAKLRIADAAWLVRGRLRLALLEVFAAQENLDFFKQQHEFEQAISQHLQQQQAAGELAETDVSASQLGVQQSHLALTAADKKLADSFNLLAAAIGLPVSALTGIEFDFSEFKQLPDLKTVAIAKLQSLALRERPDVLASLADYAAAQSALQLEIANQYPNIQTNPGYAFDVGEHRWSLGATVLQLPVFNQNQGLIAEMTAKRQEAAQRFEALQLRILGEIDRAHASVLAVQSRWEAAGKVVQNRQANLQSTRDLLTAGEIDAHALTVAELEQSVAEKSRLDVLVESQQALAMLEAALRQPFASWSAGILPATSGQDARAPSFRKKMP